MLEVPSNGALEPTFKEAGADEGFIAPLPCRGGSEGPVGRGPCSEARGLTDLRPGEDAKRGELGSDISPAKMGVPKSQTRRPG